LIWIETDIREKGVMMDLLRNLKAENVEERKVQKDTFPKYPFFRTYGWYFALSLVAALFTPKDILTSHPILKEYFVDPVSSLVPVWLPMYKFSALSDFPEVILFTTSLLVAAFPVAIIRCASLSLTSQLRPNSFLRDKVFFGYFYIVMSYFCVFLLLDYPEILLRFVYKQHGLPNQSENFVEKVFLSMLTSRIVFGSIAAAYMTLVSVFFVNFFDMHKEIFSKKH
jgi:hypothetical protein